MVTAQIVDFFVNDTIKMAGGILLLTISYKIYKLKCDTESNCGWFKFLGHNSGGAMDVADVVSNAI